MPGKKNTTAPLRETTIMDIPLPIRTQCTNLIPAFVVQQLA